jgi:hypothetical protein
MGWQCRHLAGALASDFEQADGLLDLVFADF